MCPCAEITAALGPPVPRSTARTKVSSGLASGRSRRGVAVTGRRVGAEVVGMAAKRTALPAPDPYERPDPASRAGGLLGQAGFDFQLDLDLVTDHDAAVQQGVVERHAEV